MLSLRVLTLAAASLLFAGCEFGDFIESERFREDFHKSYEVQPGGRLTIENTNGSVEITGWEKNTVDINGTKYASTESAMRDLRIDIVQSGDSISIRTVPPSGYHRGGLGARYTIRVPSKFEIERVTSSNGGLRLEAIDGNARLRTSNGAVRVSRLNGRLDAESSNGSIEVNDQVGDATLRTSNGRISAENVKGNFEARTSNGSINARIMDPLPDKAIKAETNNGSIDLALDNIKNNAIRASTSNSSITVRVPSSTNALVRAHTSNSSITTDFDVTVRGGHIDKHSLEGSIGSGGPLIDLGTSNGSIKLLKL